MQSWTLIVSVSTYHSHPSPKVPHNIYKAVVHIWLMLELDFDCLEIGHRIHDIERTITKSQRHTFTNCRTQGSRRNRNAKTMTPNSRWWWTQRVTICRRSRSLLGKIPCFDKVRPRVRRLDDCTARPAGLSLEPPWSVIVVIGAPALGFRPTNILRCAQHVDPAYNFPTWNFACSKSRNNVVLPQDKELFVHSIVPLSARGCGMWCID
jgi:hypothetical protein